MGKVSSPELASLAAKYLDLSTDELSFVGRGQSAGFVADVRSLAASVLAQAEPSK